MRGAIKSSLTLAVSLCVSACSLHPLPEQVTGLDTYAIVVQIRCEARAAVRKVAIEYLRYPDARTPRWILDKLALDDENLDRKMLPYLDPEARQKLEKYSRAAIGLEFALQMTEDNSLSAGTNILRPFAAGADLLGFGVTLPRSRRNLRNFKIIENWRKLAEDPVTKDECLKTRQWPGNYMYPIAGEIGIFEIVDSYTRLNEKVSFATAKDRDPLAFVDDLLFTTTLMGSLDPSFSVTQPAGRNFLIRDGKGGLGAGRTDQHGLTIAVYIPPPEEPKAKPGKASTSRGTGKGARSGAAPAASPEEIVSQALNRATSKRFLFGADPFTTLRELQR